MSLPARLKAVPAATPPLEGERVERAEPRAGEFWRYVGPEHSPPDDRYRPGDVLLVAATEFADGRLHNVDVRGHPRATRHDSVWSMLLAEFLDRFEPVAAHEADAVRAREVAGVLTEIDRLRQKFALCDLIVLRLSARDRRAAIDRMADTYATQAHFRASMAGLLSGDNRPADWTATPKAACPSLGWISGSHESQARRIEPDERRDSVELLHPDAAAWLETVGLRLPRAQESACRGEKRRTAANLVKALATLGIRLDPPSKKDLG